MLTTEIEVTIKLEWCNSPKHPYSDGLVCPLATAISEHLKDGFYVIVGPVGAYTIVKAKPKSPVSEDWLLSNTVLAGKVNDFNGHTVSRATKDFTRQVRLPIECVK